MRTSLQTVLVTSTVLVWASAAHAEVPVAPGPAPQPPASVAPGAPPPTQVIIVPSATSTYAPPQAYYLPPSYGEPPPYEPPPRVRRSTAAMTAGAALVGLGGAAFLTGVVVSISAGIGAWARAYDSNCTSFGCRSSERAGLGLLISGLIAAGVGIPLLVYGAKRVPARSLAREPGIVCDGFHLTF
ncbi:Hypothetical protein A7982_09046 [Minicystis rosea]|nr:Hypothetical protein A7982_09046 [Minicystis rosea]